MWEFYCFKKYQIFHKNSHAKLLIFWNDDNLIAGVGPRYGHEWIKLLEPITNVNISHKNN